MSCAVGTRARVAGRRFYKKLPGTSLSLTLIQGLNANGYAYGVRLSRPL